MAEIGVFVRDLGIWKRAIPHVKNAGVWKQCQKVWAKDAGVWKVVWADPERNLTITNFSRSNFDAFSPFQAISGWKLNTDGTLEEEDVPGSPLGYTQFGTWDGGWDVGRTWEVKYHKNSGTFGTDTTGTKDVWKAITNVNLEQNRTAPGSSAGIMEVQLRETGGPLLKTVTIDLEAEAGLL